MRRLSFPGWFHCLNVNYFLHEFTGDISLKWMKTNFDFSLNVFFHFGRNWLVARTKNYNKNHSLFSIEQKDTSIIELAIVSRCIKLKDWNVFVFFLEHVWNGNANVSLHLNFNWFLTTRTKEMQFEQTKHT